MSYFKQTFLLNHEEKKQISEMSGKIILWILEGRDIGYMSEKLHLSPQQMESNINEMRWPAPRWNIHHYNTASAGLLGFHKPHHNRHLSLSILPANL